MQIGVLIPGVAGANNCISHNVTCGILFVNEADRIVKVHVRWPKR